MGRPLTVDVTVSHPSQASLSNQARTEQQSASLSAAAKLASDKVRKHGARCAAAGVDFLPLAVCSYGGWLPDGVKFVNQLADMLADHSGVSRAITGTQLWQRLSITLWRTNARCILHRAPSVDLDAWDLPGWFAR